MKNRQRMTWAALDRGAAAAPATPGYGVDDQDHPAHTQDDPGQDDYNIGGPSEFGEDVHKPPYGDSGAPANPGYGVEDQDHPAHQGQVGRQANLMSLVRRKSAKALKLAQATLGKKAQWADVEEQAFAYMSMDDEALDASLDRLSGGFLAEDAEPAPEGPLADEFMDEPVMGGEADPVMARLKAMEDEITALKSAGRRANQNDPKGPTLGASGKSAEEEKKEEAAVSNKAARAKLARLFTACDMDDDGFVTQEDWIGPPAVFAALDTDKDGIIAKHEVMAGEVPEAFKKQWDKGDDKAEDKDDKADAKDEKKDEKESGKKAGKKSDDEAKESGKKSDDEKVEAKKGDEKTEGKKGGKKSDDEKEGEDEDKTAKTAFGHLADFDDDELEMLSAMQYGLDELGGDEDKMAAGDAGVQLTAGDDPDEGEDKGDDEGGDDSDKEASFFTTGFDPMGLADGTNLTAADKAAFEEVFGKQAGEDEAEEGKEGEDEAEEKKANQRLASLLKPQPRKASTGVRTVGTQARTASGRNEVTELSSLWASDPDVSGSFS